ncbi:hypothetical protein ACWEGE_29555 [Amycolatopsis sp. NPDC004747]
MHAQLTVTPARLPEVLLTTAVMRPVFLWGALAWAAGNGIHPWMVEYLTQRPDHLWSPPPKTEEPFSTPRSWHMLSDLLHSAGDETVALLAYATLTPAHAGAFRAYLEVARHAFDLEAILKGDARWARRPRPALLPRRDLPRGWSRTCPRTSGTPLRGRAPVRLPREESPGRGRPRPGRPCLGLAELMSRWQRQYHGKPEPGTERFARGLIASATEAMEHAADARGRTRHRRAMGEWDRALSWFVSSFPLLGAVAAGFTLVVDTEVVRACSPASTCCSGRPTGRS